MTLPVSRLRAAGIAKEVTNGVPIINPARYLNIIPPDSFTPMIEPLPSKGIQATRSMYPKITQGPATLNGMKAKLEVEPENIGEILQACFGADVASEFASFVVQAGVNDKINFKENGGAQLTGTIAAGTYIMGVTSATVGTLCKAIKTALEGAAGAVQTYTVTYSYATKKVTITPNINTIQILWGTGTNAATSARTLLGFTNADTANAAAVTSNSTTQTAPWQHVFTQQPLSQMPTYTWWFDKGLKFPLFAGSMLNKLDLALKAKGIMEADTDWSGKVYDDIDGIAEGTVFSSLVPFVWANAVINVDGAQAFGYDNLKLGLNNMIKFDHALNNSIYPYIGYSEGFTPDLSAELFFEDTVQYQKFLAGTTAHLNAVIASGQIIGGTVRHSLTIDVPAWYYKSANLYIPSNGPLKIPFTGLCKVDPVAGYDVQITLINSVFTAY